MDPRHYVPILLTRQGERFAVRDAPTAVKDAFTPLFVVAPIPWDYEADARAKTLDDYLADVPNALQQSWGSRPAFIDLLLVDDDGPMTNGQHPLVWLTAACAVVGLPLTPIVSPNRTPSYRQATAAVVARDHLGAAIRLQPAEWPSNAPGALNALVQELGLGPGDVDLILDLGAETGDLALVALRTQLATLPQLNDWRSLIAAGAGMPRETPSGAGIYLIPRGEWARYRALVTSGQPPARIPTFGDYGIAHPDPTLDVDPKLMSLSATLRYTCVDNWLLAKGQLWKGPGGTGLGGAAMPPVAASVRAHQAYLGDHHCALETWIVATAGGGTGGNPMTWRRHGTLHHLHVVTDELANLPWP